MKCINKEHITGKNIKTAASIAVILILIIIELCSCGYSVFNDKFKAADIADKYITLASDGINPGLINFANENVNTVYANSALMYDISDNKLLYSKNINDKLYPASTTKVLTAYCTLKHGNLKDRITVSENCVNLERGASICGFKVGDKPTLEEALYGLMTCSGNDAAIAIAEHISGSVEAFADLMNKEAAALGATHTHFTNPHGLHEKDHYTTPQDLYLIFKATVENPRFREILTHSSYTADVPNVNGDTRKLTWSSTNRYLTNASFKPRTVDILGTKTGYTNEAGACLVTLGLDHYGKEYITVIMKTTDPGTVFLETTDMYNTLVKK